MNSRKRAAALTIALAIVAGACGDSVATPEPEVASLPPESVQPTDTTAEAGGDEQDEPDEPEIDPETAYLQYSQCLEDLGVEDPFADLDEGTGVVALEMDEAEYEKFEKAQEECDPILDDAFGTFEPTPEQEAEFADAELKFNNCMADKGFDLDFGDEGGEDEGFSFEVDGDLDFEAMDEAMQECGVALEGGIGVTEVEAADG